MRTHKLDFIETLSHLISLAFEYENKFLNQFWPHGGEQPELLECYMVSERTRVVVLLSSGERITDTIKTSEFMDWCENLSERPKLIKR